MALNAKPLYELPASALPTTSINQPPHTGQPNLHAPHFQYPRSSRNRPVVLCLLMPSSPKPFHPLRLLMFPTPREVLVFASPCSWPPTTHTPPHFWRPPGPFVFRRPCFQKDPSFWVCPSPTSPTRTRFLTSRQAPKACRRQKQNVLR